MGKFSLQFWLLLVVTITSVPLFAAYAEKNDLDNDGIPDDQDHCPHLPEDYLDETKSACNRSQGSPGQAQSRPPIQGSQGLH